MVCFSNKVKNSVICWNSSALGLLLAVVSLFLFFVLYSYFSNFLWTFTFSNHGWIKKSYKNSLSYDQSELTKNYFFYQKSSVYCVSLAEASLFLFLCIFLYFLHFLLTFSFSNHSWIKRSFENSESYNYLKLTFKTHSKVKKLVFF